MSAAPKQIKRRPKKLVSNNGESKKPPGRTISHKFRAQDFVRHRREHESIHNHYTIGKLLGEGQFGEVYVGTVKGGEEGNRGDLRAIKKIHKCLMDKGDHEEVFNEFTLLKQMDHPNILKMYEILEDKEDYWIVTELCSGGELLDELEANGPLTEAGTALVLRQVLSSIHYCHTQKKVAHRDLKLENILLEEGSKDIKTKDGDNQSYNPMIVKVIDFGLAVQFEDDQVLTSPVGSMHYIAPEVLEQEYGPKCDVWSCGVIAFILLCGYAPFEAASDMEQRELIMMGRISFNDPAWDNVSQEAKDFVSYLMTYEPNKRPTAEGCLQHPWIQNAHRLHAEQFKQRKGGTDVAMKCLNNCRLFEAASKLKQATCVFMTSQLVLGGGNEKGDNILNDVATMIGEIFRAMDLDSDGRLSSAEFRSGFQDFMAGSITEEEVQDIFQRVDLSATGFIDYSEFVIAAIGLHDQEYAHHQLLLKQAFQRLLDHDGSGFISKDKVKMEMVPFYGEDVDDEIISRIIHQADHDQDGQISWEDFQAMMSKTAHFIAPANGTILQSEEKEKAITPPPKSPSTQSQTKKHFVRKDGDANSPGTPSTTPKSIRKASTNMAGPKARLISAIFEKNLEKNREMGFETFQYTREQQQQEQQKELRQTGGAGAKRRALPRTRRLNFEELTRQANTKVDFDPNAKKDLRNKEIEQLKNATPGRAREKRMTITSAFSQEKEEHRKRRESRLQELQNINSNSLSARGRQNFVAGVFKDSTTRKLEEQLKQQRTDEMKRLQGSIQEEGGAKNRGQKLFELFQSPKPQQTKTVPVRFNSDSHAKTLKDMYERELRLGELQSYGDGADVDADSQNKGKTSFFRKMKEHHRQQQLEEFVDDHGKEPAKRIGVARRAASVQIGSKNTSSDFRWMPRFGKARDESVPEHAPSENGHEQRKTCSRPTLKTKSPSIVALQDLADREQRLEEMQPRSYPPLNAALVEPVRRQNSFNRQQEEQDRDMRLDELMGAENDRCQIRDCDDMDVSMSFQQAMDTGGNQSSHARSRLGSAERASEARVKVRPGSARASLVLFERMNQSTGNFSSFAETKQNRLKELHPRDQLERNGDSMADAFERFNSSMSTFDQRRKARHQELQQVKASRSQGTAKSAMQLFEENIKSNKEWENSNSSFGRLDTSANSSFSKYDRKDYQARSKSMNPKDFQENRQHADKAERRHSVTLGDKDGNKKALSANSQSQSSLGFVSEPGQIDVNESSLVGLHMSADMSDEEGHGQNINTSLSERQKESFGEQRPPNQNDCPRHGTEIISYNGDEAFQSRLNSQTPGDFRSEFSNDPKSLVLAGVNKTASETPAPPKTTLCIVTAEDTSQYDGVPTHAGSGTKRAGSVPKSPKRSGSGPRSPRRGESGPKASLEQEGEAQSIEDDLKPNADVAMAAGVNHGADLSDNAEIEAGASLKEYSNVNHLAGGAIPGATEVIAESPGRGELKVSETRYQEKERDGIESTIAVDAKLQEDEEKTLLEKGATTKTVPLQGLVKRKSMQDIQKEHKEAMEKIQKQHEKQKADLERVKAQMTADEAAVRALKEKKEAQQRAKEETDEAAVRALKEKKEAQKRAKEEKKKQPALEKQHAEEEAAKKKEEVKSSVEDSSEQKDCSGEGKVDKEVGDSEELEHRKEQLEAAKESAGAKEHEPSLTIGDHVIQKMAEGNSLETIVAPAEDQSHGFGGFAEAAFAAFSSTREQKKNDQNAKGSSEVESELSKATSKAVDKKHKEGGAIRKNSSSNRLSKRSSSSKPADFDWTKNAAGDTRKNRDSDITDSTPATFDWKKRASAEKRSSKSKRMSSK